MPTRTKNILIWIVTFLVMLIICMPGLWIILSAFRTNGEILTKPAIWIPQNLTLDNFKAIFGYGDNVVGIPVSSYFRNSLVISVTSTFTAVLIGMTGGYAFARYDFPGKGNTFLWLMLSRTVPGIALSLPIFIIWSRHRHHRHPVRGDPGLYRDQRALHHLADRRFLPPGARTI